MSDNTEVVTMPVEVFAELNANTFHPSVAERAAATAQALVVLSAVAAVVPIGSYAWVRCQDWLDERREQRAVRKRNMRSVN